MSAFRTPFVLPLLFFLGSTLVFSLNWPGSREVQTYGAAEVHPLPRGLIVKFITDRFESILFDPLVVHQT
jgi:hypothetical protein